MDRYAVCFRSLDADADGRVTWQEFQALPGAERAVFDRADADAGGVLDHDEWHAFERAMGFGGRHQ
jgi:hypothetical protein